MNAPGFYAPPMPVGRRRGITASIDHHLASRAPPSMKVVDIENTRSLQMVSELSEELEKTEVQRRQDKEALYELAGILNNLVFASNRARLFLVLAKNGTVTAEDQNKHSGPRLTRKDSQSTQDVSNYLFSTMQMIEEYIKRTEREGIVVRESVGAMTDTLRPPPMADSDDTVSHYHFQEHDVPIPENFT